MTHDLPHSSTNDMPLVSVLTPSFNQSRWLPTNLASVAAQHYPYLEHIVCDGASTDGSVEILRGASNRCRWLSEPDHGQSDAINKAFRLSTGSILGWLNSDDAYFSPRTVARVVAAFQQYPHVGVVYGHALMVDSDGAPLQTIWVPRFSPSRLHHYNFISQPTVFVRRSLFTDFIVDQSFEYMMDRELWMRLAASTAFMRIGSILAIDRDYAARKSYARRDLYVQDDRRIADAYALRSGTLDIARRKLIKAGLRWMGVTLIDQVRASRRDVQPPDSPWSVWRLAVRQALLPRRYFRLI